VQAIRGNRYALIQDNNILNKSDNMIWKQGEFNGTPFDRDYISIESADKLTSEPPGNTYYFISALKFDEKDIPTPDQQYFLQKLGEYLRNYPSARVGLDLKYSRGMNSNRENAMLTMTRNIMEKAGASRNQISKMSGKEEIQQEQQQQQQQLNANVAPPSQELDRVLIYVSGIDASARGILLGYLNPKAGK